MLDHEGYQRLAKLVEELTDKKHLDQEPVLLKRFKALCKTSDANIQSSFELLLDRLKAPHAQVRLHAVALCNELFMRSRAFRMLMAQRFSRFLELAVGHRAENPLPGPADVAIQLRELALETIEIWTERFGSLYRQVELGHHYLKHMLNFEFPELRIRAAAQEAETRSREARAAQILEEKYQRIQAEFPGMSTATLDLLAQLEVIVINLVHLNALIYKPSGSSRHASPPTLYDRCVQLLQGREPALEAGPTKPEAAGGPDEEDWEDIVPAANVVDDGDREGLAAYADQPLPEDLLGASDVIQIRERDPAVIENLRGLDQELQGSVLAKLQDWLRTLVKVDAGAVGSAGHTAKEQLLRSALEVRGKLTAASEKMAEVEFQLKDLPQSSSLQPSSSALKTAANVDAASRPAFDDTAEIERRSQTGAQRLKDTRGMGKVTSLQGPDEIFIAEQKKRAATSATLADLFGSSDDDDNDAGDANAASLFRKRTQQAVDISAPGGHLQQDTRADERAHAQGLQGRSSQAPHKSAAPDTAHASLQNPLRKAPHKSAAPDTAPASLQNPLTAASAAAPATIKTASTSSVRSEHQRRVSRHGVPNSEAATPAAESGGAWPEFEGSSGDEAGLDPLSGGMPIDDHSKGSDATGRAGKDEAWPAFEGSESEDDMPLGVRQQPLHHPPVPVSASLAAAQDVAKASARGGLGAAAPLPAPKPKPSRNASTLPESIKEQLLQQAPVIPGGRHLAYWDSDKASAMVDSRALEISNHWGPVDAQAELPAERMAELFGTVASYITPSAPKTASTAPSLPSRRSDILAARQQNAAAAAADRPSTAQQRSREIPQAEAGALPAATRLRAQRAADRAHNDAVLSAAGNDEQIARSLAHEDVQAAQQETAKQARGTKRKLTVRERLAKKLLSGRTLERVQEEAGDVENERTRDREANNF